MKKISLKNLSVVAAACLALTSCDFLDVVPNEAATTDDIYKTPASAMAMVVTCYNDIPNYFQSQKMPDWTGGNDMIMGYSDQGRWFHYFSLLYGTESPSSTYFALWSQTAANYPTGAVKDYNVWKSIRNCYNVLNNIDKVPAMSETDRNTAKGEVLFLIGYYHQVMLEYYGPVILAKEEYSTGASTEPRNTYDECVDFIAAKYDEAAKLLPAARNDVNRATSVVALAYKARLLLYAASPLVNGNTDYAGFKNPDGTNLINQTYDPNKWKKAMDAAEAAIQLAESNGYKLYGNSTTDPEEGKKNYHDAFTGPGGQANPENAREILFGSGKELNYNIKNIGPRIGYKKYSKDGFRGYQIPSWDCVAEYYTKNGLPWDDDPETKGKDPYSMVVLANGDTTALWNTNREPRFYASIGYDRGTYEIQGGTITIKSRQGEPQGVFTKEGEKFDEYQSNNGYFSQKYVSTADSWDVSQKKFTGNSKYYFPMMRLAELYLDYAEADFEFNGKLSAKSLGYLDKIRQRSGLPTFEASWAKAGGIPTGDKLRQVLHQERSIELAMEGRRYHDIRRWKIAVQEMMRPQLAWNIFGHYAKDFYKKPTVMRMMQQPNFQAKNIWFAIPIDQIQINKQLVQNPGY